MPLLRVRKDDTLLRGNRDTHTLMVRKIITLLRDNGTWLCLGDVAILSVRR